MIDFKIQRFGKDTDTTYKWFPVHSTIRPLNPGELGLHVPSIDEMYPLMDDFKMLDRAKKSLQANAVAPIGGDASQQTVAPVATGTNVF